MSDSPTTPDARRRGPAWVKWLVIGGIAAVVLFFGGIFLYAKVLNDSPDEFSAGDLDAALSQGADESATATVEITDPATTPPATEPAGETSTSDGAVTTTAPATESASATETEPATSVTEGGSSWAATDGSQVGYRVEEILFGVDTTAVGRTDQVTGSLTISGTQVTNVDFEVDVASIASDEGRRDEQFRGRIMSADEFPTATFVLTEPIELGAEPGDGVEVTTTATGELTLRGSTQPVTFDVVAKQENGLIGVQGSIPVLFADYGIANPSFGGITTEDNGLVEFVLVFTPA
jgi:polyisoprenoid-binding protein YceI